MENGGTTAASNIRVRYAGFIKFGSLMLSIVTGLIFTLLIIRRMSVNQFGSWTFIFQLIGLFYFAEGFFPFWVTRFVAYKKEGAVKTAVTSNLLLSLLTVAIYLSLLPAFIAVFHITSVSIFIYAVASLQIINAFMITSCEASLQSIKPQVTGYGLLIEEVVKVVLALIIVLGLKMLLIGAITGIIVGSAAQVSYYVLLLRNELASKIHFEYLWEWLKGSTLFLYNVIGNEVLSVASYMLVYFASPSALAYYQVGTIIAAIVTYSSALSFTLYPKLLSQNSKEDREKETRTAFQAFLIITIPLTAIAISMSPSFSMVLNRLYAGAYSIIILFTVYTFGAAVLNFYSNCVLAAENLDIHGKIPLKQLWHSKIFAVFTLVYVQSAILLPSAYVLLSKIGAANPFAAAEALVAVMIVETVFSIALLYILMRDSVKLPVAWISTAKCVVAALAMGAILYFTFETTTLLLTIAKGLIGILVYIIILSAISHDARTLMKQIWSEIKKNF